LGAKKLSLPLFDTPDPYFTKALEGGGE
jgi:hypothetical protein